MKTSIMEQNGITDEMISLIDRLIQEIPWPNRRKAMGDVAVSILKGKHRVAEYVFGWNRATVLLGMNEFRTGITCVNDIANRRKRKVEETHPQLLNDIHQIMDIHSQAQSHLRTTLLYANMTAKAVFQSLLKKGWSRKLLPTNRTISNILNRHNYRLRSVVKTKVQKKTNIRTQSSKTFGE